MNIPTTISEYDFHSKMSRLAHFFILSLAVSTTCFGAHLNTAVRQTGAWASCSAPSRGTCFDTSRFSCTVPTVTGRCPGSASIRCCPSPGGISTRSCSPGVCKRTEFCTGRVLTTLCPGPSSITCCKPTVTTAPPTTLRTTLSGPKFLPDATDVSDSLGSCETPFGGFKGNCLNVAKCTGGTFNNLCPGSSSILCCVPETRPTERVPASPFVTQAQFETLFTSISKTRATALYPYFLKSLEVAEINTCLRLAAFAAQVGHESSGLRKFEEGGDGDNYEGSLTLGNTKPGDGRRYKGRGPIQLTGRYNYNKCSQALGRNFLEVPDLVGMPSGGFEASAWFWKKFVGNANADLGTQRGYDRITISINGCGGKISGCRKVEDRNKRWRAARTLLGC